MSIKRVYEFFDDEDLRSQFEIPHLKGEMADEICDWETFSKPLDSETPVSFFNKILFKFPILKSFHSEVKKTDDNVEIFCFYDYSEEECENGNEYYVQLVISYDITSNEYFINIVLRNKDDFDNQDKWKRYDVNTKDVNMSYGLVESFLSSCVKLNVISPLQKSSLLSN
jgi:hypothetical protein